MATGFDPPPTRKLVVVGDVSAQTTALLLAFTNEDFPFGYIPTTFDHCLVDVEVVDQAGKKRVVGLGLWDTAHYKDYDSLRPLVYPQTDVILVCFSVKVPESFENIQNKWIPEIEHYCRGIPFIIVGHKTSLEDDINHHKQITCGQGRRLATKVGAVAYMECCAETGKGVNELFVAATLASLREVKKTQPVVPSKYRKTWTISDLSLTMVIQVCFVCVSCIN